MCRWDLIDMSVLMHPQALHALELMRIYQAIKSILPKLHNITLTLCGVESSLNYKSKICEHLYIYKEACLD